MVVQITELIQLLQFIHFHAYFHRNFSPCTFEDVQSLNFSIELHEKNWEKFSHIHIIQSTLYNILPFFKRCFLLNES